MSRLRLPDLSRLVPASAAEPSTSGRTIVLLLSRREFLRALGVAGLAVSLPWVRVERAYAAARGRFLTAGERRTLAALAESILPADDDPGGAKLGVGDYVERLLTAFDHSPPRIYAGGPFSGRNPFVDYARGRAGRRRPKNRFKRFVEPTRLQRLYWRWQILGTNGLTAAERALVAPLDAQLGGPLAGLRTVYRQGLQRLDALAVSREGRRFASLADDARDRVRDAARMALPADPRHGGFLALVVRHTMEGAFAAPEYGGNRRARGWRLLGLEGDSQPLGYALYSRADDAYHERVDHPLSTPDPDEVAAPKPLSGEARSIQDFIVLTTGSFGDGC
jgi:hypothetical protein